ncbi:DUF397 domain-containing protein [Amycolatopsis nalaikhensis]|uniref:DUF397 domain-containing protein n=1 Tax=Amycolatopsis nalaikhensis TaxID=715472 RepID=A0ABY8XYB6_9PSEU|nr:DUF397 domain-containing protein [Amycolatopsis sp. 2-2]WIV60695.1 DUF397 domain-containing protein [Amycolatopsis sp. 2-2]
MTTSARHQAHRHTGWFKSSFSPSQSGCVEVRFLGTAVQVRDTKDHGAGPILSVDIAAWPGFIAEVTGAAATDSNDALRIEHCSAGGARLHSLDGTTTLLYTDDEWIAFTAGAAHGEFAVPAVA